MRPHKGRTPPSYAFTHTHAHKKGASNIGLMRIMLLPAESSVAPRSEIAESQRANFLKCRQRRHEERIIIRYLYMCLRRCSRSGVFQQTMAWWNDVRQFHTTRTPLQTVVGCFDESQSILRICFHHHHFQI